jgi:F5/8 type C domain
LVALSILDPTSGKPGVFFANNSFFKNSQSQPLCQIRVGVNGALPSFTLPVSTSHGSLVNDDLRSYHLPLSRTGWVASASVGTNPSHAIDRDAISRWSTDTAQNSTSNQWFKLDMGSARQFDRISLDTKNSPEDFPRSYLVEVSNNNVIWSPVATGADRGPLAFISFPTQNARWLRIKQTGSTIVNWWSIHELEVFSPTPVACFTGSTALDWTKPNDAFDGNTQTRWATNYEQTPDQWIQVDLRCTRTFSKIILNSARHANDYPTGYRIEVSTDLVTWTAVAQGAGAAVTTDGISTIPLGNQTTRYIRITQTGTSPHWWGIDEFGIAP